MLKPSPDIEAFELKKLAAVGSGLTGTGWTGTGCTTSAGTTGVGWTGATGSVGAISSLCGGAATGSTKLLITGTSATGAATDEGVAEAIDSAVSVWIGSNACSSCEGGFSTTGSSTGSSLVSTSSATDTCSTVAATAAALAETDGLPAKRSMRLMDMLRISRKSLSTSLPIPLPSEPILSRRVFSPASCTVRMAS